MILTIVGGKKKKRPIRIDLTKSLSVGGSIALTAAAMGIAQRTRLLGRTVRAVRGEAAAGALGVAGYKAGEALGRRAGEMADERFTPREGRSEIVKRSWKKRREKYGPKGRRR